MDFFSALKFALLAALVVGVATVTWEVQDWRWQSKETNYVKEQIAQLQKEENREAKAASQFEQKQEANNDTFKKVDKALQDIPSKPPVVCFNSRRLHVINSALARKAPASSGPPGAVPGPDAAVGK